jgi:hypothetical protein
MTHIGARTAQLLWQSPSHFCECLYEIQPAAVDANDHLTGAVIGYGAGSRSEFPLRGAGHRIGIRYWPSHSQKINGPCCPNSDTLSQHPRFCQTKLVQDGLHIGKKWIVIWTEPHSVLWVKDPPSVGAWATQFHICARERVLKKWRAPSRDNVIPRPLLVVVYNIIFNINNNIQQ